MPSDNRRWFNSQACADTLLRIHCRPFDPGAPRITINARGTGPVSHPLDETGTSEHDSGSSSGPDTSEHDSNSSSGPGSKQGGVGGETSQPVRTYHAHAVFLRGQSAYFDACLGELWPRQQQQQQPAQHKQGLLELLKQSAAPSSAPGASATLDLHLDPGQEDAMDLLLRFMYDHPLPAVTPDTTPLLLQCLHLADRFDVPQCVGAILSTLKGHRSIAVNTTVLRHADHATPGISGRPDFEALLVSAKRFVIDTFGKPSVVVRIEKLRQGFCALPFIAVLAWAQSDELQVQSENCVVYLLSIWVKAAQQVGGQGVSADQLEQLAQQVRVLHLGPAYQHHILPQLGWFKGCSCSVHLPTLLAYKGKDAAGNPAFPDLVDFPARHRRFPAQWVARARQQSRVTDADQVRRWEVGDEQMERLLKGKTVYSPPHYLNGFMLRVSADTNAAADGARTLGLYVGVNPVQAEGAIPWPVTAVITGGRMEFKVLHGREGGASRKMSRIIRVGTARCGYDMLSRSVPSASDLVAPYLKDGKLHVEARFTTVDQPSWLSHDTYKKFVFL